jgi:hypothetical protein
VGIESIDDGCDKRLPQRTKACRKINFLFDQFQIELPLGWNAIILPAAVGIGPVGVRP